MKRLAGGVETHFRTTDHSGEIAWLQLLAVTHGDKTTSPAYAVAAELLQGHDEAGISLDEWGPCRELVEHLLGHPILENEV